MARGNGTLAARAIRTVTVRVRACFAPGVRYMIVSRTGPRRAGARYAAPRTLSTPVPARFNRTVSLTPDVKLSAATPTSHGPSQRTGKRSVSSAESVRDRGAPIVTRGGAGSGRSTTPSAARCSV